jgi:hypothetical protein
MRVARWPIWVGDRPAGEGGSDCSLAGSLDLLRIPRSRVFFLFFVLAFADFFFPLFAWWDFLPERKCPLHSLSLSLFSSGVVAALGNCDRNPVWNCTRARVVSRKKFPT